MCSACMLNSLPLHTLQVVTNVLLHTIDAEDASLLSKHGYPDLTSSNPRLWTILSR